MKSLVNYILESEQKIRPTTYWAQEHYVKFNKMYFGGELPGLDKVTVKAIDRNRDSSLARQGVYKTYYISKDRMRNDKYVMLVFDKSPWMRSVGNGKWEPVFDGSEREVKSIVELDPFIIMNSSYLMTQNEMEDTLLHEMVHLYCELDGTAPRYAHGKEFKKKCKEVRELAKEKYGKEYSLMTKLQNPDNAVQDNEYIQRELKRAIQKAKTKGGGIVGVYFELSEDLYTKNKNLKRFFFCTKNVLDNIMYKVKYYHIGKMTCLYITEDSYEKMSKEYGAFKTVRTYRYWKGEDYSKAEEYMKTGKNLIET